MSDDLDALLAELGPEPELGEVDPRMERLVAGELSAEELTSLRQEAEHDPELAAQLAMFEPPEAQRLERYTKIVDNTLGEAPQPPTPPEPTPGLLDRLRAWMGPALLGAGLALAAVLFMSMPEDPGWQLEVDAGDRTFRSTELTPDLLSLTPGSVVPVVLRGGKQARDPIVSAWLDPGNGKLVPVSTRVQRGKLGGSLRVFLSLPDDVQPEGRKGVLTVSVGSAGSPPSPHDSGAMALTFTWGGP